MSVRSALLLIALASVVHADPKPNTADAAHTLKTINAILIAHVDAEMRPHLLLQACSEIPSCASGCSRELSNASHSDPADTATILSSCDGIDFHSALLSPAVWIERHWKQFLDAATPFVAKVDLPKWRLTRQRLRL